MGWSFSEGYLDGVQGLQRPIYKQHVLAIDVIVRGVGSSTIVTSFAHKVWAPAR